MRSFRSIRLNAAMAAATIAVAITAQGAAAEAMNEVSTLAQATPGDERGDDVASAHERALSRWREVAGAKGAVSEAIAKRDLAAVEKLHTDIKMKIADATELMDSAFLRGAWTSSGVKKNAASLRGRLEGVHILNFILLAMLTGYEHPTGNVPASVIDANDKMFRQLDAALVDWKELSAKTNRGERSAARTGQGMVRGARK